MHLIYTLFLSLLPFFLIFHSLYPLSLHYQRWSITSSIRSLLFLFLSPLLTSFPSPFHSLSLFSFFLPALSSLFFNSGIVPSFSFLQRTCTTPTLLVVHTPSFRASQAVTLSSRQSRCISPENALSSLLSHSFWYCFPLLSLLCVLLRSGTFQLFKCIMQCFANNIKSPYKYVFLDFFVMHYICNQPISFLSRLWMSMKASFGCGIHAICLHNFHHMVKLKGKTGHT